MEGVNDEGRTQREINEEGGEHGVREREREGVLEGEPSLYSSMPPIDIGTNGIIKQLKNLNQNKATGPDELPARELQNK